MQRCEFCRIAAGETDAQIVYQDERAVAFQDNNPQGPVHLLVIPREHIVSLDEARPEHELLLGHLLLVAAQIAREAGLDEGHRTVINTASDGGQTVFHIHVHVIGGRRMRWPPG